MATREVHVNSVTIGGDRPLVLVAGSCVIEGEEVTLRIAKGIKEIASRVGMALIFKSSYDKANRSSIHSYRGPGLDEGLRILRRVKEELRLPVLSDVHRFEEIERASTLLDVIQVPAFLCRQTDFIVEVARAGKAINIKKGPFLAPWDMRNVIEKVTSTGNQNLLLTERGTTFGYNNLVSDMRSLAIMRSFGYPVVYDATHSVQLPGAGGDRSGGQRELVPQLARAATATGIDALFMEVHEDPSRALCDGGNSVSLDEIGYFLTQVKEIDRIVKDGGP
ncbi:MAG: 3-deoxy-8-phosphooctulonate synthase [Deltaproteobacteria bacterium]|nr:3-deoxy-8-phosphooctulonate synthase [Deltaproteobacteria bacterium]